MYYSTEKQYCKTAIRSPHLRQLQQRHVRARLFIATGLCSPLLRTMLARPVVMLRAVCVSRRTFSTAVIKCDLSRPRHAAALASPPAPGSFSHDSAALKLTALNQLRGRSLPSSALTSCPRSLTPIIQFIASECASVGDAAIVELPCPADVTDAIAALPFKLHMLGSAPDWCVDLNCIVQAATRRTSLIALQSVNLATGVARPAAFFAALTQQLHAHNPNRRVTLLVNDTFFAESNLSPVADFAENIVFLADLGAQLGAPDHCCIVRGGDAALHAAARNCPLLPASVPVIDRLSSSAACSSTVIVRNLALFRAWMQGERQRLRWHDPGPSRSSTHCLVSLAPGVEMDPRRFYSELERRGGTRVGRGSEWSIDDCSFMVVLSHVDADVLQHGLQAISSALDVWASHGSSLGLSSIY